VVCCRNNAGKDVVKVKVNLSFLKGQEVSKYFDDNEGLSAFNKENVKKDGTTVVSIRPNGGIILIN
jgi:hypothetical protein